MPGLLLLVTPYRQTTDMRLVACSSDLSALQSHGFCFLRELEFQANLQYTNRGIFDISTALCNRPILHQMCGLELSIKMTVRVQQARADPHHILKLAVFII